MDRELAREYDELIMKIKSLTQLLLTHGKCTEKDGEYLLEEGKAVTLYASLGQETLMIESVIKLAFNEESMLLASTEKGDLFVLVAESVHSLKFGRAAEKRRTGII